VGMTVAIFVSKILGPIFIIVAISMMSNKGFIQKIMEDFSKNSALQYLAGVTSLVFGLVIIIMHNEWVSNWTVIITIFGWMGIFKGAWLIVFPNTLGKFTEAYVKNTTLIKIHSVLALILGVFLTYLGYFG